MEQAAFIGLGALLILVRHLAARRVAGGDGRFVWLVFLPSMLGCAALIVIGAETAGTSPIVGIAMAAVGLVFVVAMIKMFLAMSARVSAMPPGGDITEALTDPLANFALLWGVLLAVIALVAVIVLIVWGVLQTGN